MPALLKDRAFVVRAAQWLLAVMCFATADFDHWDSFDGASHFPRSSYAALESGGVLATIWASALLLRAGVRALHPTLLPSSLTGRTAARVEAAVDVLGFIFVLAVAIAAAAAITANNCWEFGDECGRVCFTLSTYCATQGEGATCPQAELRFSVASAFLLCVALCVGLVPTVHELARGRGVGGGLGSGDAAPDAPAGYSSQLQTSLVAEEHVLGPVPARVPLPDV